MPDKTPSIALGAAAYVIVTLGASFLISGGGMMIQSAAGCFACVAILAGPMLAVWHYTSTHHVTLLAGQGAAMGAFTGAAGAIVGGLLQQALIWVDVLPDVAETLDMQRRNMIASGMDPAQVDSAMKMGESMSGLSSNPVMGILLGAVVGAAIGALFGALAASMFKKGADGPAPIVRERA